MLRSILLLFLATGCLVNNFDSSGLDKSLAQVEVAVYLVGTFVVMSLERQKK
jgi:uncharacterized membrane protein